MNCFNILSDARMSGLGYSWEYYHFLIDFATVFAYNLMLHNLSSAIVYVPDTPYAMQHIAKLTSTTYGLKHDMKQHFDLLFPNSTIQVGKTLENKCHNFTHMAPAHKTLKKTAYMWSQHPAYVYKAFQRYAMKSIPQCFATRQDREVLIIRRSRETSVNNGYKRRHLPDDFFANASRWLTSRNKSYVIFIPEKEDLCTQIRQFTQSRVIIGIHGAAFSTMVFMKSGSLIIEGPPVGYPCYKNLASRMNLTYHRAAKTSFSEYQKILERYWVDA